MFCDPVWNIVHSIACLGFWENKLRDCLFQNDQYVYGVTGVVGGGGGADKNNFFTKREKKLSSQYIFSPGDVKGCACSNWAWLIQSFIAENETVICKHPVQNCMSTIWFRQEPLLSYCCTKRPQTVWVTSPHKVTVFSALHQGVTIVGMVVDTKSLFFSLPCMNYSEGVIMTVGMVGLCLFWEIQLNTGGSACPCFPRVPVLSRWPL